MFCRVLFVYYDQWQTYSLYWWLNFLISFLFLILEYICWLRFEKDFTGTHYNLILQLIFYFIVCFNSMLHLGPLLLRDKKDCDIKFTLLLENIDHPTWDIMMLQDPTIVRMPFLTHYFPHFRALKYCLNAVIGILIYNFFINWYRNSCVTYYISLNN